MDKLKKLQEAVETDIDNLVEFEYKLSEIIRVHNLKTIDELLITVRTARKVYGAIYGVAEDLLDE